MSVTAVDVRDLQIFFFFQEKDGIRDWSVTGVQTCALRICFCAQGGRSGLIAIFAHDKPDRPPWAQKPKTASTDKSQPAPKPVEPDDSQEGGQRGRIRDRKSVV